MCSLEKRGNIFILALTGSGEHRLNRKLLDGIQSALRRVRSEPSSALITTAQGKFFCNGLDLAWAREAIHQNKLSQFRDVIADLTSLPMPTIAAVTGHASAGGLIFTLSHDYVVMRKDRGFLYMSELDVGLKIPEWCMSLIRCKIGDPMTRRDVVLRAMKMTAEAALKRGIIHSAHDGAGETIEAAVRLGVELERRKFEGHVYAQIRARLLDKVLDKPGFYEAVVGDTVGVSRSRL